MFKMPEPANEDLANDISAIDAMYRGDPSYEHDAYYMRKAAEKLVRKGYSIYAEAQLKQVRREALEEAARVCLSQDGVHDSIYAAAIRKLMEGL